LLTSKLDGPARSHVSALNEVTPWFLTMLRWFGSYCRTCRRVSRMPRAPRGYAHVAEPSSSDGLLADRRVSRPRSSAVSVSFTSSEWSSWHCDQRVFS